MITLRPEGSTPAAAFTAGSLLLPWGIAVDGSDTVWVADFSGQRVTRLCGVRTEACPPGHRTGQPISPATAGYGFDGLVRNTGVQIDPSGNVWLTNNWELVPLQTNPGGRQLVLFVGLATPVRTPLMGPPRAL
uniref:SMP-30/Gluconolactonase/LRE-like region domain-containing protein n=1 Tax=Streptomyces sp. NBC_00049 TaxID=2903617 RepID=A0AAU2JYQ1_9ACTN